VWGCLANAAVFLVQDRQRLRDNTVWHGFDARVLAILVTLALQGLCVAAVVKHMSNVAKVRLSPAHTRASLTVPLVAPKPPGARVMPAALVGMVCVCVRAPSTAAAAQTDVVTGSCSTNSPLPFPSSPLRYNSHRQHTR
jgi:hypothetical protein